MKNFKTFIESGILESYVSGNSTRQETDLVEQMAETFDEIRAEIDSISEVFELFALAHAITPGTQVKPMVLATVDYTERIRNGEQPTYPPELKDGSRITDFSTWLNRPDMVLPDNFNDLYARIIGYTPKAVTAIVWVKDRAPAEVHENEYERFLIVEGTCKITVEEKAYPLGPGDFFSIPLHKVHQVIVTSSTPCKVILQRMAA